MNLSKISGGNHPPILCAEELTSELRSVREVAYADVGTEDVSALKAALEAAEYDVAEAVTNGAKVWAVTKDGKKLSGLVYKPHKTTGKKEYELEDLPGAKIGGGNDAGTGTDTIASGHIPSDAPSGAADSGTSKPAKARKAPAKRTLGSSKKK